MFTDNTTKVDSKPSNGSNDDITNPYECDQTLNVSAGPGPQLLTPRTISSGLVPQPPSPTPNVPPIKNDWDSLFCPMFDEYFNPSPSVLQHVLVAVVQEPVVSTGTPSSTRIDQDTPSTSTSQTTQEEQSHVIPTSVEEDDHGIEVAHMDNDLEGFKQIVDFLKASYVKTVNGEVQLQALVDRKKVIITETSVRRDLQLEDAEGIACLPNADIFEQLALMGAKSTAWNEFSSTMASAIICLATNQKFNFSKYIFESMVKNVDSSVKFLMYPRNPKRKDTEISQSSGPTEPIADEATNEENRVLDLENTKIAQAQEILSLKLRFKRLEKKGWSRTHKLKRLFKVGRYAQVVSSKDEGLGDQEDASKQGRKITDIDQDVEDVVEKEVSTVDPNTTAGEVVTTASVEVSVATTTTTIAITEVDLTLAQALAELRSAKPKLQAKEEKQVRLAREKAEKVEEANISWDNVQAMIEADSSPTEPIADEAANEETVLTHSNDPLLSGEDKKKGGSRTHKLKRLFKVGRSAQVISSKDEGLGDQEDASKQGRKIYDIDKDAEVTLVDETQGRYGDDLVFDKTIIDVTTASVEVSAASATPVSTATTTTTTAITEVDLTLAQALAELRSAEPKVVVQELVQNTTTTAPLTIPKAKSITFRDPGESTTRTTLTPIPSNIKDKCKAKMIEPEKPLKMKEQIRLDEELAFKL
ncbi:hypothetical protein Tco_0411770 [Tanacetum coccineum]